MKIIKKILTLSIIYFFFIYSSSSFLSINCLLKDNLNLERECSHLKEVNEKDNHKNTHKNEDSNQNKCQCCNVALSDKLISYPILNFILINSKETLFKPSIIVTSIFHPPKAFI